MRTLAYVPWGIALGIAMGLALRPSIHKWKANPPATKIDADAMILLRDRIPVIGRPDAPIKVVEFGDYACPVCRERHEDLNQIVAQNPEASLVFRHFPLPRHPLAWRAAIRQSCAAQSGDGGRTHARLMVGADLADDTIAHASPGSDTLDRVRRAGVDVAQDVRDARGLGVRSVPAFFVSLDRKVYRVPDVRDLEGFVKRLSAVGTPP